MKRSLNKYGVLIFISLSSIVATACGSNSDVSLIIQGTKPSSATTLRLDSLLQVAGSQLPNASTSSGTGIPVIGANAATLGVLTLTDARVALKEIKFEQEGEHDSKPGDIQFRGPYVVNLLTNEVAPALETVTLPEGKYAEVKLKLHKILGGEKNSDAQVIPTSDPLFGHSIYLAGSYTATGGSAVPFVMSFNFDEEFELTGPDAASNGVQVLEGSGAPIIIAFRLAKWFDFSNRKTNSDQVDFNSLTIGSELNLGSDASDAQAKVRSAIKEAIKASADYGKDEDGDGNLSSSEDDDDDALDENDS